MTPRRIGTRGTLAGFAVAASLPLLAGAAPLEISARAHSLHFQSIVVDTHDDTTQRLLDPKFDLGERHTDGSIDIRGCGRAASTHSSSRSGRPGRWRVPRL